MRREAQRSISSFISSRAPKGRSSLVTTARSRRVSSRRASRPHGEPFVWRVDCRSFQVSTSFRAQSGSALLHSSPCGPLSWQCRRFPAARSPHLPGRSSARATTASRRF
jgi:hypothetical protein